MAEFGGGDDNWGLQAIVRGSTGAFSAGPDYGCGVWDVQNDDNGLVFGFPDDAFQSAAMSTDELEELYKPFYPVSCSALSPALDVPCSTCVKDEIKDVAEEVVQQNQLCPDQSAQKSKYKRRKNQQKRVVVQAAAEGLSSDKWAWRKYGQKPIKGSPYPRSYYRCSSSKGCLARKQVEQSFTDPSVFILTYTAEHNHTQPTRKNALAGTTRQKLSSQKGPARTHNKAANSGSTNCSPSSSADLRVASTEGGCAIKQGGNEEIISTGIKMEDEFFAGLEDLDGLISELNWWPTAIL